MGAMRNEAAEQIIVHEWVKNNTDLPFIHIANERRCSPQRGNLLRKMGVKKGVSDIFIPRANQDYHGLWIELKAQRGTLSRHQENFITQMRNENYFADVAFGANAAIEIIKAFYDLN